MVLHARRIKLEGAVIFMVRYKKENVCTHNGLLFTFLKVCAIQLNYLLYVWTFILLHFFLMCFVYRLNLGEFLFLYKGESRILVAFIYLHFHLNFISVCICYDLFLVSLIYNKLFIFLGT